MSAEPKPKAARQLPEFQNPAKAKQRRLSLEAVEELLKQQTVNDSVRFGVDEHGLIESHAMQIAHSFAQMPLYDPITVQEGAKWNGGNDIILGGWHRAHAFVRVLKNPENYKVKITGREILLALYIQDPDITKEEALRIATVDNSGRSNSIMDLAATATRLMGDMGELSRAQRAAKKREVVNALQAIAGPGYMKFSLNDVEKLLEIDAHLPQRAKQLLHDPSDLRVTVNTITPFLQALKLGIYTPEELSGKVLAFIEGKMELSSVRGAIRAHQREKGKKISRTISDFFRLLREVEEEFGDDEVSHWRAWFKGSNDIDEEGLKRDLRGLDNVSVEGEAIPVDDEEPTDDDLEEAAQEFEGWIDDTVGDDLTEID